MAPLLRFGLALTALILAGGCGGSTESTPGDDSGASDSSSAIDARGTGDAPVDAAVEGAVDAPIDTADTADVADAPPCPVPQPTRRSACTAIDQVCFYGCGVVLRCTKDGWDNDFTIDGGPPCP